MLGIGPGGLELGRSRKLRSQWRVLLRAHEPVVGDILPEKAGSVKRTVGPKSTLGPQPCKGLVGQEWLRNVTAAVVLEESESQDGQCPQRTGELQEAGDSISKAAVTLS